MSEAALFQGLINESPVEFIAGWTGEGEGDSLPDMLLKTIMYSFVSLSFAFGAQAEVLSEIEALKVKNRESRDAAIAKLEKLYLAALVKKFETLVKNNKPEESVPVHDEIIRMKERESGGEEIPKSGLKILSAVYGSTAKAYDVTEVIRGLVKGNKLDYVLDPKIVVNPQEGVLKRLRLSYQFGNGSIKALVVNTKTRVVIPSE